MGSAETCEFFPVESTWRSVVLMFMLWVTVGTVEGGNGKNCANCLSDGALAGVVFGCIFGTILVSAAVALGLLYLKRRRDNATLRTPNRMKVKYQTEENFAYDNPEFHNENGMPADHKFNFESKEEGGLKRKKESIVGGILSRKDNLPEGRKSTESLNSVLEVVKVPLKSEDFTGLGFNIHGNMRDGIFVKEVLHRGPARDCGNIQAGDKILKVTISFENMVFEDAFTILSYASPYTVELELQKPDRRKASVHAHRMSQIKTPKSDRKAQRHPLYKSQSIDDMALSFDRSSKSSDHKLLNKDTRRTKSVQETPTRATKQKPPGNKTPVSAMESISEIQEAEQKTNTTIVTAEIAVNPKLNSCQDDIQDSPPKPARIQMREDPYADLSPEERMQVLRLSYEDPEVSQSTPNLYHPVPIEEEELSSNVSNNFQEEEVSLEHQKLTKAESVGKEDGKGVKIQESDNEDGLNLDLSAAKEKLEARKALLSSDGSRKENETSQITVTAVSTRESEAADAVRLHPTDFRAEAASKMPSPPSLGMEFETWEVKTNGEENESENVEKNSKIVPAQNLGTKEGNLKETIYQKRQHLQPSMEKSNWLRPAHTSDSFDEQVLEHKSFENGVKSLEGGMKSSSLHGEVNDVHDQSAKSGHMTANGSAVSKERAQSLDSSNGVVGNYGTEVDREQYQKLLYFQEQLAKQHEELTRMGIHIPMNLSPLKKQPNQGRLGSTAISNGEHNMVH